MYEKTFSIGNLLPTVLHSDFLKFLSHNSPAKGWPYRFRSRGTTGSSILDHDFLATCVVVDESKCLDIPIWDFSIFCDLLPFYLGRSRYCVCCLSTATWQSGDNIHDFCCGHLRCWWSLFGEYCIRPRVVLYNVTTEYNSTFVLLVLCPPTQHFSNDICPSMMQNELLRPTYLLHRSPPFLLLTFLRFHAEIFFNKFVNQIFMLWWIISSSCNVVFMMIRQWFSNTQSCRFTSFQNTRKSCFLILLDAPLAQFFFILCRA